MIGVLMGVMDGGTRLATIWIIVVVVGKRGRRRKEDFE